MSLSIRSSRFSAALQLPLYNYHCIPVTVEPIPLRHGLSIRSENQVTPSKGRDQEQQSGAREVKVCDQPVDHTKAVAWINEQISAAPSCLHCPFLTTG